MARYGYGMSVSGSRTPFVASGGAAPSGIPTAGPLMAVNINIQGNNVFAQLRDLNEDGSFYSVADGYWNIGVGEDNVPVTRLTFGGSQWTVISSNSFEPPFDNITNSSPNQSIDYIPTSGWSPSITITAA